MAQLSSIGAPKDVTTPDVAVRGNGNAGIE